MERKSICDLIEKPITGEWGSEGGEINVLRTTNFTNDGKIDFVNVVQRDIAKGKVNSKRLQKGDIIIEKSGGSPNQPVGRVVFFEDEGTFLCNNFTSILRPLKKKVFPKYLMYQLFACHKFGVANKYQNKTTGIINLKLNRYLKEIKIPLPQIEEQKRIAAALDQCNGSIYINRELINRYEKLIESLFLEMFGNPVDNRKGFDLVQIRDLITEAKYGTSAKASSTGDYPYLRMNNITYEGYMDYTDLKFIDLSPKDIPKYTVRKGDILFNRTNSKELVGKTGLITTKEQFAIAGYLIRVRTNKQANPYYIWAHLNSQWAKANLKHMCKSIVGMANINAQELQKIKILKAPIELQNKFAERVQNIEKQKTIAQHSLLKSEELYQSLLQKAFKGELLQEKNYETS